MKDMYELLNDINIDEDEFEEMEVTDLERARVKTSLKKSIKKNKMKVWKKSAMAAAIIASLSVATIGLTFPTYASSIPVVGDIFRFLDNGRTGLYDEYKEYSTEMNMIKESKGIKVTINDAIFDGETVSLTYTIESDKDLGEDPFIHGNPDFKGSKGMAGSSRISKVDKNYYVGIYRATDLNRTDEDKVKIKWNLDSIIIPEKKEEIKGNWSFAFALNATDRKVQLSDHSSEQDGVKVNIEKISVTPMSFIVYYDQVVSEKVRNKWHGVDVDLEIKDDLGNSYSGESNGGSGDSEGYFMSWSKTFEKLNQNATKLIITPHITLREYTSDNFGSVEITKDGPREIPIPKKYGKGKEEFVLKDIIIDLKD